VKETDFLGLYPPYPFVVADTPEAVIELSVSAFFLFKESSNGLLKKESS
jgi:hypothetical protein